MRRLKVEGSKRTLDLGASELRKFSEVTVTAVLQCAGNGRALIDPPSLSDADVGALLAYLRAQRP